jgi:CRISPR system Cascade subunit CasB
VANRQYLTFAPDSEAGRVLYAWWEGLKDSPGDRAELRRCSELAQVVLTPAYHRLRRELLALGTLSDTALAVLAGVLAHLEQHDASSSIAAQMAEKKGSSGTPKVSGLRFRRILKIRDYRDLYIAMVRVVRMLRSPSRTTANLYSLADSIYRWNNDAVRQDWARDYYTAAPGEP